MDLRKTPKWINVWPALKPSPRPRRRRRGRRGLRRLRRLDLGLQGCLQQGAGSGAGAQVLGAEFGQRPVGPSIVAENPPPWPAAVSRSFARFGS